MPRRITKAFFAAAAAGATITTLGFAAASAAGAMAAGKHSHPRYFTPTGGTPIPSFLWNDGNGFSGMGNDAFGVWRFPF